MPTYAFKNTKTNEVFEKRMKISERDDYLKQNPDISPVPVRASGVGTDLAPKHISDGFKDVLKKIRNGGLVGKNNSIDKWL